MDAERRNRLLLGALVVVLAVVLFRAFTTPAPPPPTGQRAAARSDGTTAPEAAPDVHLEALEAERPAPSGSERNLFRFGRRTPAPGSGAASSAEINDAPPPGPFATPPVAAAAGIPLKFIGIVERTEHGDKIAILSDGRGVPFHGREGDVVAGRYRILRIGAESIEMANLDGGGRQTIRLSGS